MSSQIIGAGWRFPLLPDAAGGLSYVDGDQNVEQSLKILLLTGLGQRMMRPDFGTQAPRMVFAPGSVQYLGLLENSIREAVRDWEPRIDLEEVSAEVNPLDETQVTVQIGYRIRQTNTRSNLVFPFYLGTLERG
jgi:phage baseplate assembly protein W